MMTDVRPWGTFDLLHHDPEYWVKRLVVWPGQALSLQSHNLRTEEWIVVSGFGKAFVKHWPQTLQNGNWIELQPGVKVSIPQKWQHRLINDGDVDLVVIEVGLGVCLEEDIHRYEDDYGRPVGTAIKE